MSTSETLVSSNPARFASLQQIELERAHASIAPAAFFRAWKTAASLAGAQFFGTGTLADLRNATSVHDLRPNLQQIADSISVLTSHEKVFVAALVSVHNSAHGARLLHRVGVQGLADLGALDLSRRALIAALIHNYTPW